MSSVVTQFVSPCEKRLRELNGNYVSYKYACIPMCKCIQRDQRKCAGSIALRYNPLLNLELNGFFGGGVLGYFTPVPILWLELHMATPGFLYGRLGFTQALMLMASVLTP